MARRSLRNFITQLRAMAVDDTELGPNVSEDIQLTYQLDDFSRYTRGEYASGGFFTGVGGDHQFMQLEVRSPFGAIIESVVFTFLSTTPQSMGVMLQTTAFPIIGGVERLAISSGPPPDSIALHGVIDAPDIPQNRFMCLSDRFGGQGIEGLFIPGRPPGGPSHFFGAFLSGAGSSNNQAIRWTELNKYRTSV